MPTIDSAPISATARVTSGCGVDRAAMTNRTALSTGQQARFGHEADRRGVDQHPIEGRAERVE